MARLEVTEAQFQKSVLELAARTRWHSYHPPANVKFVNRDGLPSVQRISSGWPDLTLARPPELLFAELKSARGRLSPAQHFWIELLRSCGQEVHVWRPEDWAVLAERLS